MEVSGGNLIEGNLIGTDVTGTANLGNASGVHVVQALGNTIGGIAAGARNVISGNGGNGVFINGLLTASNLVQGNFIGVDVTGTGGLGNNQGVRIFNGSNNTIGGMTSTARNVVSGNSSDGIAITASDSFSANANVVQGNFVGTDVSGTVVRPNGGSGMVISVFSGSGTASNNTIGGTMAGAGNVISGNNVAGVSIVNGASGNTVQGTSSAQTSPAPWRWATGPTA